MKRVKVYSYPNGMVLMVAKNHGYDRNKSNVRFWKKIFKEYVGPATVLRRAS